MDVPIELVAAAGLGLGAEDPHPRFQSIFYLSIPRKSLQDEELTLTAPGPCDVTGPCDRVNNAVNNGVMKDDQT